MPNKNSIEQIRTCNKQTNLKRVLFDFWTEGKAESDFEEIAESLFPMQPAIDYYWTGVARAVFSAAAYRMKKDESRSIKKLLYFLLTAELDVLENYLKGTKAETLVSDRTRKNTLSIRSVISTYLTTTQPV